MTSSTPKPIRYVAILSVVLIAMSTFGTVDAQDQTIVDDTTSETPDALLEAFQVQPNLSGDETAIFAAPETDGSIRDDDQPNLEYSILPNLDLNLGLIKSDTDRNDYEFREAWELPGIYMEPLESDLKAEISTSF
ncbi:hypothetical protein GCM10011309_19970 [Litorimonas cladophorae]|uniref:WxL domain-containing protein n=1 Tax=Litorimonas cladophorae TaxID=1220491 RepID=A0A918NII1_9PROT|nr:hypothetical protein [Litorimonas cladophorae]GGX69948.1 hypothetical protein GCM10011309_19970 [Litorimonas cladophorae]